MLKHTAYNQITENWEKEDEIKVEEDNKSVMFHESMLDDFLKKVSQENYFNLGKDL